MLRIVVAILALLTYLSIERHAFGGNGVDFDRLKDGCGKVSQTFDCLERIERIERKSKDSSVSKTDYDREVNEFINKYRPVVLYGLRP